MVPGYTAAPIVQKARHARVELCFLPVVPGPSRLSSLTQPTADTTAMSDTKAHDSSEHASMSEKLGEERHEHLHGKPGARVIHHNADEIKYAYLVR